MTPAPITPELRRAAPLLAGRFTVIMAALAALIARAFLKNPRRAAVIVPLWNYLGRTARRFARLAAGLAKGRRPRPARVPQPGRSARPRRAGRHALSLPTARGWLLKDLKHEAALYGLQLETLLAEPEAAQLLAAAPTAARLLRPICRMLGISPPVLPPLPPRARKPRPKPAPKPRRLSRKQREAILWYPNMEGRPMKLLPPRKFRA
jgi:hypothetical protein